MFLELWRLLDSFTKTCSRVPWCCEFTVNNRTSETKMCIRCIYCTQNCPYYIWYPNMKKIREITASSNTINKMSELPRNFPGPIRNKGRYYHRNRKPQKLWWQKICDICDKRTKYILIFFWFHCWVSCWLVIGSRSLASFPPSASPPQYFPPYFGMMSKFFARRWTTSLAAPTNTSNI